MSSCHSSSIPKEYTNLVESLAYNKSYNIDKKVRALVVKNADLEASKLSKLEKSKKAL